MLQRFLSHLRDFLIPRTSSKLPPGATVEPLEARIAPATFVNPHVVTYTDVDGDHVTITSSKPVFSTANMGQLLTFASGATAGTQQLEAINFTGLGSSVVGGDNISVTAHQAGGGDGMVNVGIIESSFGLGHVTVQGDLGAIDAGSNVPGAHAAVGLVSLNVHSMGVEGITTQASGGALLSTIYGAVGSITVQSDMVGTQFSILSNTTNSTVNGNVGLVKIGGTLEAGTSTADLAGSFSTSGNIGSVSIAGGLQGGSGTNSGSFQVGGKIGTISIGPASGSNAALLGSSGPGSASIVTGVNSLVGGTPGIGKITITGDVVGGAGDGSAYIGVTGAGETAATGGPIGTVKITGALTGGAGDDSGQLNAFSFGSVTIGKGITGSSGIESGALVSTNGIKSILIQSGGIVGGTNTEAGSIIAATAPTNAAPIGSIVVYGDITGDSSAASTITKSGQINTGSSIGSFTLHGSLIGSTAETSGSVIAAGHIGHVTILANGTNSPGSIEGGAGSSSGEISAASIGTVSIAGQIAGGGTVQSGSANTGASSGAIVSSGSITSISVGDGIVGGAGAGSGIITTGSNFGANLGTLKITTGGITGGVGADSGVVSIGGAIKSANLNSGAITGGTGSDSGQLTATDGIGTVKLGSLLSDGVISAGGNLTSLTFGSAAASNATVSGEVEVGGAAGTISVYGNVVGTTAASTGLFLIGGGAKNITIKGELEAGLGADSGSIFAGLDDTSVIRSITVTGGVVGYSGNNGGSGSGEVFGGGGIVKGTFGDLIGGTGDYSGAVVSDGAIGAIVVTGTGIGVGSNPVQHGIVGGYGDDSGQISSGSTIKSISVHGSLVGGNGTSSGTIVSNSLYTDSGDIQGDAGSISISGNITGGTGVNSGQVNIAGNITTINVTGNVTGALQSGTGGILAGQELTNATGGNITTLKIGGALQGVVVPAGEPQTITGSGFIEAGHIGAATIGAITTGAVGVATHVTDDGAIIAANDIASLTVTGSIAGDYTNPVLISAVGQLNPGKTGDLALGKINVGGSVSYANFLAGYDQSGNPVNGSACIGAVVVGGNWSGSNAVAGVIAGTNGDYGALNDTLITNSAKVDATIASIIIKGKVETAMNIPFGDTDAPNTYGFVAAKVEALSVGGVAQDVGPGYIAAVGNSTDTDMENVS